MGERPSSATRVLHRVGTALLLIAWLTSCDRAPRPPSRTWEGHLSLFVPQTEPGVRAESFQTFTVKGDPTLYRLKITPDTERLGGPVPGRHRPFNPLYRVTGRLLAGNVIDVVRLEYVGAPPRPEVDYQLADAVDHGDLAGVRAALAAHANPNTLNHVENGTVLLGSCNVEIKLALLAAGADPKAHNEQGFSALNGLMACESPNVDDVRRLLDAGVEVNPTGTQSSPLYDALLNPICRDRKHRSPECRPLLKLLLERGATFNQDELDHQRGRLEWQLHEIVDAPAS